MLNDGEAEAFVLLGIKAGHVRNVRDASERAVSETIRGGRAVSPSTIAANNYLTTLIPELERREREGGKE